MKAMTDLCVRCGKPTAYDPSTPITLRRYFVEGAGQLCEECYYHLWPRALGSDFCSDSRTAHMTDKKTDKE